MKNRLLTLICICSISSGAFAGTDLLPVKGKGRGKSDSKVSLGLSVGAGLPMGNFARNTNPTGNDSTLSGYAKLGFHFNVNFGYKFSDMIGAMIQIGGNMNGVDINAYNTANKIPTSGVTTTATSYYVGSYLLGPFLSIPAGDKLAINIRVLGGLMTAKSATITETYTGGVSTGNYGSAKGFGYDAGAGVTINATDKLGINVNLDYLGSTQTFSTLTYTNPVGTFVRANEKRPMSIGILNISLGLALHF